MRDMICKKCGAKFEGNFCPKCGTPAEKELNVCPKCGQERGAGDRYCPKCGYDFARSDRKESVNFGAKAAETVKKVPKKAWAAIAAIVLVVIVIIVLVAVLSNKFRLGVVEKIGIGDSRQSVIELLGEPYDYREGSSTFTYYSNNYLKLLEKNDSFDPDDIEDWGDFEDAFNEAMELEQKLQTEEYKSSCSCGESEAIVSAANVFEIIPVSKSSFIESVRLRSMERARCKLRLVVPSCAAISSSVIRVPFWHSVDLSPFGEYPHNLTYSTITFRCFASSFSVRPKFAANNTLSFLSSSIKSSRIQTGTIFIPKSFAALYLWCPDIIVISGATIIGVIIPSF